MVCILRYYKKNDHMETNCCPNVVFKDDREGKKEDVDKVKF